MKKEFLDETEFKEFEERADFIESEDLIKWTVENEFFLGIQNKILQKGAKLIVGPRGTGKTHQMRFAYNTCLHHKNKPLAIYASFTKYYHLEPFLSKKSNAITIFHTWVLSKILLSCYQLLYDLNKSDIALYEKGNILSQKDLEKFAVQTEKGIIQEWHDDIITNLTIDEVINTIEELAIKLGRKRTILLLDDAALTLTPEYLIEFFDVFRSLKTIKIAPKASVYPGTTVYGPRFSVGEDAEKVPAWLSIENENYHQFMDGLIEKRTLVLDSQNISKNIIRLFQSAAFGNPRSFINLLRDYISSKGKTVQQRFNNVINERRELIKGEYLSLTKKLPQYRSMIEKGWRLHEEIIKKLTTENKKNVGNNEKQLQIGILREHNLKLDRMLQFLIEAGLLFELTPSKGGYVSKEYNRYIPHLLFLIQNRAFTVSKGPNFKDMNIFLKRQQKKYPLKVKFDTLLGLDAIEQIGLNLPPCQHCETDRLTEQQKFCHDCGKELVRQSTFDSCMQIKMDELPITKLQKQRINEQTNLHTIGDLIFTSEPATELRKAKGIGAKRAETIYKKVMQIVEEFLA